MKELEFLKDSAIGNAEKEIIKKVFERANVGLQKYGVTTDREDLTLLEWLNHALEEQLDNSVYIKKVIQEIETNNTEITKKINTLNLAFLNTISDKEMKKRIASHLLDLKFLILKYDNTESTIQ